MSREKSFFTRPRVIVGEVVVATALVSGAVGTFFAGVADKLFAHVVMVDCAPTNPLDAVIDPLQQLGYEAAGGHLAPCDPTTPVDLPPPDSVPQSFWQPPENQTNELA